ncbi:MAG: MFS transporter [Ferruginibacter sp.]
MLFTGVDDGHFRNMQQEAGKRLFTRYQVFIISILTILQFTVVLDFMVLSPLGAILLDELHIEPSRFGLVVSAYAFSAGISGILAAGFADKFDRKKLLLFFYCGFIAGTVLCAIAPSYHFLLIARIITGLFGGVLSSINLAIITDLFRAEVRGRVMGFIQMGFAASQIMGIPVGLVLANHFGWHAPFWMIVGLGIPIGIALFFYMQPVSSHLAYRSEKHPFLHLAQTVTRKNYLLAFSATTLLATGGFMLMPFSSAFAIHNIGLTMEQLPVVYSVTGLFSIMLGPAIGKFSDIYGRYRTFLIGSVITTLMVFVYTNLGVTPIHLVIIINIFLFMGILSRGISSTALNTSVPELQDRGAFMSVNAAVQQISGGISAFIAGLIVFQEPQGYIRHYQTLGYVVIGSIVLSAYLTHRIHRYVQGKDTTQPFAKKTTQTDH